MSKNYFEIKSTKQLCRHLGISEIEAMKIEMRCDLAIAISEFVEAKKWTHAAAAKEAGTGRTVITAIMNGSLDKISTDRMIDIARGLGLRVSLKVAA